MRLFIVIFVMQMLVADWEEAVLFAHFSDLP
jgi:hypothetical protein